MVAAYPHLLALTGVSRLCCECIDSTVYGIRLEKVGGDSYYNTNTHILLQKCQSNPHVSLQSETTVIRRCNGLATGRVKGDRDEREEGTNRDRSDGDWQMGKMDWIDRFMDEETGRRADAYRLAKR